MPLTDITDANFGELIEKYNSIVFNFWAPSCGPCRTFSKLFEAAAEKYPDTLFGRINVEEEEALSKEFQVMSTPTILAIKDGTIEGVKVGALRPDKFEAMIKQTL